MPTSSREFNAALQHHQAGRLAEAQAIYRQILAHDPRHFGALNYLGVAATQLHSPDAAIDLLRRSIAINPNWAESHYNLGIALSEKGRPDAAIAAYRQAVAIKPHAQAYCNLGFALNAKRQYTEAAAAFRQAIAIKPQFPEAWYNLGNSHKELGQLEEAVSAYQQAIRFNARFAEAYDNLGTVLIELGKVNESIAAYRAAIGISPGNAEAYSNLGNALRCRGELTESIAACRQSITLRPDFAEAHSNLAFALLMSGDYVNGLPEYEWRWNAKHFTSPRRGFTEPRWNGEELNGRTLLIHAEQGFGDAIQFLRYVPMAVARGGRAIVECHAELKQLLLSNASGWQVTGKDEPLLEFDLHCPLLSLPLIFRTTLETIPVDVPYIRAESQCQNRWSQRLAEYANYLKVGLVWAGNPAFKNDRIRSPRQLSLFSPLAGLAHVKLFSLQKGEPGKQIPPGGMRLIDWTGELHDFGETAGLIANLDLVISSDTAVAHLAGAMGKQVWVLLSSSPDWRWMLKREDCPWYPTMRLFRQDRPGDWVDVIKRVCRALSKSKLSQGVLCLS